MLSIPGDLQLCWLKDSLHIWDDSAFPYASATCIKSECIPHILKNWHESVGSNCLNKGLIKLTFAWIMAQTKASAGCQSTSCKCCPPTELVIFKRVTKLRLKPLLSHFDPKLAWPSHQLLIINAAGSEGNLKQHFSQRIFKRRSSWNFIRKTRGDSQHTPQLPCLSCPINVMLFQGICHNLMAKLASAGDMRSCCPTAVWGQQDRSRQAVRSRWGVLWAAEGQSSAPGHSRAEPWQMPRDWS